MQKPTNYIFTRCVFSGVLFVLLSLYTWKPVEAQPPPFVMVTQAARDSAVGKWQDLIYTEVFQRLNLKFTYKEFPLKRGELMLNSGEVDGDFSRSFSFGNRYSNVIRVTAPVSWFNIAAYATCPPMDLDGWTSLGKTDYKVSYLRGSQLVEHRLTGIVAQENISVVDSYLNGLKKLKAGWTDIIIGVELINNRLLKTDEFRNSGIRSLGVLERIFAYPYLNKKHAHLVPKFEAVLKAMAQEGLIEQYRMIAYGGESPL